MLQKQTHVRVTGVLGARVAGPCIDLGSLFRIAQAFLFGLKMYNGKD